jgi:hypothetical protein
MLTSKWNTLDHQFRWISRVKVVEIGLMNILMPDMSGTKVLRGIDILFVKEVLSTELRYWKGDLLRNLSLIFRLAPRQNVCPQDCWLLFYFGIRVMHSVPRSAVCGTESWCQFVRRCIDKASPGLPVGFFGREWNGFAVWDADQR